MHASARKHERVHGEVASRDLSEILARAHIAALAGDEFQVGADEFLAAWEPHYSREELTRIVTPQRTLARRLAKHESLTVAETDRAMRLARIVTEVERIFADADKAAQWLRRPNGSLNEQSPLALLWSEAGARAVEDVLIRIDHGMFG